MVKRWVEIALIGCLILFLAACSSGAAEEAPSPVGEENQSETVAEQPEGEAAADQEQTEEEEVADVPEIDPASIYTTRCAGCHAADRSGDRGPALLPERLSSDAQVYISTITNGSGGMPAFGNRLSAEEIDALVEYILTPPG